MRKVIPLLAVFGLVTLPALAQDAGRKKGRPANAQGAASGDQGLVVSGTGPATAAGVQILQRGGNAADAGAAALLALSVTAYNVFCIGGEVPVMVYDAAHKDIKVLAGQGAAPLDPKAIDWYLEHGIPGGEVKAAAVPSALDAIVTLLKMYGTRSFGEVVQPTLAILDQGGPTSFRSAGKTIDTGRNWRGDLAATFRKLAEAEAGAKGTREQKLQAVADRFYRGDIADALEKWYIEKGGFLRKADLAAHRTRVEDPVHALYRGYAVYKVGPWTQGPYLLEALRLLEGFDLKAIGFLSADYIHTVSESMKLALADRDEFYGDPNFVKVPMQELLSDRYTELRRPLIDMSKASLEIRPGDPYNMKPVKTPTSPHDTRPGTTTMCVIDRWGNVIAATPSGLDSTAGVAGETGIMHGTRLTSLNSWKGTPNVIAPGKRPRVTLSPTLILRDGKPVVAIAVAGGDMQDEAALQLILDYVHFGMSADDAFHAPRFSTYHFTTSFGQGTPKLGNLQVNPRIPADVVEELKRRQHEVTVNGATNAWPAMIVIDLGTKRAFGSGSASGAVQ
jgi:gamma-glutamyltranspeptidase/glutathione hydrolase